MAGFKDFVLRGNLVDLAVAVIIGTSFGAVVTTFTNWLTAQLPAGVDNLFGNKENTFGAFMNAVIAFVILAAVVYYLVVLPYTKAKEAFLPEDADTPDDVLLLQEIRDLLQARS